MPVSVLPDLGLSGIYRTYYLSRYAKGTKVLVIISDSFWGAEAEYNISFSQSPQNFAVLPVSVLPDLRLWGIYPICHFSKQAKGTKGLMVISN